MTEVYDPDPEIPVEGLCLESLWPVSVSTSARCQLPFGHEGLHDVGDGSLMWGGVTKVCETCLHGDGDGVIKHNAAMDNDIDPTRICLWQPCGHQVYKDDGESCPIHGRKVSDPDETVEP